MINGEQIRNIFKWLHTLNSVTAIRRQVRCVYPCFLIPKLNYISFSCVFYSKTFLFLSDSADSSEIGEICALLSVPRHTNWNDKRCRNAPRIRGVVLRKRLAFSFFVQFHCGLTHENAGTFDIDVTVKVNHNASIDFHPATPQVANVSPDFTEAMNGFQWNSIIRDQKQEVHRNSIERKMHEIDTRTWTNLSPINSHIDAFHVNEPEPFLAARWHYVGARHQRSDRVTRRRMWTHHVYYGRCERRFAGELNESRLQSFRSLMAGGNSRWSELMNAFQRPMNLWNSTSST